MWLSLSFADVARLASTSRQTRLVGEKRWSWSTRLTMTPLSGKRRPQRVVGDEGVVSRARHHRCQHTRTLSSGRQRLRKHRQVAMGVGAASRVWHPRQHTSHSRVRRPRQHTSHSRVRHPRQRTLCSLHPDVWDDQRHLRILATWGPTLSLTRTCTWRTRLLHRFTRLPPTANHPSCAPPTTTQRRQA